MKLRQALDCAKSVALAGVGRRVPLVVSFRLLNRCNLRCQYCHIPMVRTEEMTTDEVLATLDGLKRAGTQYLNYTGGEVLLREDIGPILARTADHGFIHSVNTNGTWVPQKIELLRRVSTLTLSLDGDAAVHDAARGKGTHAQVIAALDAALAAGIPRAITAVLSSQNLEAVDWLLDAAARYRAKITFQPARLERLGSKLPDPITPDPAAYQRVVRRLIAEKQRGNPWIITSVTGLRHLAVFPERQSLPCQAGKLYFRIEANGDVLACTDVERPAEVLNIRRHGLERALEGAVTKGCDECWGASRVEFNYAAALRWEPVVNILRTR